MKTFEDLKFSHYRNDSRTQAVLEFDNDYSVSVVTGSLGTDKAPYELAILYKGELCDPKPIIDSMFDVDFELTKEDITEYMIEVQNLPKQINK